MTEPEIKETATAPSDTAKTEKLQSQTSNPNSEKDPTIEYDEFLKLDLRIAKILTAEPIAKTDRLVKLELEAGFPELRTVVAGIRDHFEPKDLVGMKITYLANLKPRKMRGIMSEGMILAASVFSDTEITGKAETVSLLVPSIDLPAGAKIG